MKALKPCLVCKGIGWKVIRYDDPHFIDEPDDNPERLRWVRVKCWKCKGAGFIRE